MHGISDPQLLGRLHKNYQFPDCFKLTTKPKGNATPGSVPEHN